MQDDQDQAPGTVKSSKPVKAGCGIRFDPDTLDQDTGFNFEDAKKLLSRVQAEDATESDSAAKTVDNETVDKGR